jgi:hypothetical protein
MKVGSRTRARRKRQTQCDKWNVVHPTGTLVRHIRESGTAYTRTPAFVTAFGAVALLFLEGRERPVHLDLIAPAALGANP